MKAAEKLVSHPQRLSAWRRLRTRILCLSCVVSLGAVPITARADIVHEGSGLVLPETLLGLSLDHAAGFGIPADSLYSYGSGNTGIGSAISLQIAVFRATYPNAALWLERSKNSLSLLPGKYPDLKQVGDDRRFTFASPMGPNGLLALYSLFGANSSTGVAIVQQGPWLIQIKMTSEQHDAASLQNAFAQILTTLKMPAAPKAPNPLFLPPDCPPSLQVDGRGHQSEPQTGFGIEQLITATPQLLAVAAQAHGGDASVATRPQEYCRIKLGGMGGTFSAAYRPRDPAATGWTILTLDFGASADVVAAPELANRKRKTPYLVIFNGLEHSDLMALYPNAPSPDESAMLFARSSMEVKHGARGPASLDYGQTTPVYQPDTRSRQK